MLYHKYNITNTLCCSSPGRITHDSIILLSIYIMVTQKLPLEYIYTPVYTHYTYNIIIIIIIISKRFVNMEPSLAISMTWLAILYYYYYRSHDEHKHAVVNRPYCVYIILLYIIYINIIHCSGLWSITFYIYTSYCSRYRWAQGDSPSTLVAMFISVR